MGQKVNPHGLRVGVIKDWDSRWYASDEKVGDLIVEDQKIRKYLKKTLYSAGIPKIEIERDNAKVRIYLHCARPGVVIGKGGEQIEQYRLAVEKLIGKKVRLNIVEVRNPDMNAQLVAENIAQQLEKRISHRRAMKNAMARAMRAGAKGIKVCCSGRLGGREIAGVEHYHEGTIPLQTIRADIEYGFAEAATTFGRIGVKVWIYKGEILSQALRTTPRTLDTSKPYQERRERPRRDRRDGDRRQGGFNRDRQGGVLVVLHDVTQQRKTQDMQREFVANVSHELRTPLTNIRSYAETLSDSAGELPPATEKKFLGVILNESDRMTHIVQDLLTLSRFDSGKDELHLVRFPFDVAVQDLYNAVYMEAQRHDHKMKLRLEPDLPAVVADRERVLQVMMNIVSNSIKYTPNGGHILVSAGREGDRVWMQVDDDGIGIPPKDRPRIFERFYRVDKARSRQSGGTGLGLSIAKEIVDRHEGVLELVDREGPGLSMRMELKIEGPSHV